MNDHKKEPGGRRITIPYRDTLEKALSHLSFGERLLLYALFVIMTISASIIVFRTNDFLLVEVPTYGGSVSEGIIGSPRFINPLFAISDADRDLTSLVYSGLLKATPEGGLVPDLAESYSVSEDGLTYFFTLRNGITFHDGTPITADDVEFTVLKAQDPSLKSPKRANWDSVSIEKVSDTEIRFTLKQPYAPFLENTTLGVLPRHIWKDVSAEEFPLSFFNIEPIGSGPFKINKITRNSSGIPEKYVLTPFRDYTLGEPYIRELIISFYPNETSLIEASKDGSVMSINSITPEKVRDLKLTDSNLTTAPLSRIFGVFFNQNQSAVLLDASVREALNVALDKKRIVEEVLSGFGVPAESPIPPGFLLYDSLRTSEATDTADRILEAREILEEGGWELNEEGVYEKTDSKKKTTETLSFSLSTSNAPELKETAARIKEDWEKLGARVELKIFEPGDLSQNIIRPRKYDALLFGEIIGRDLDMFAFWHSSQRNDPGLNIALYTNSKVDKLLSDARATSDQAVRIEKYREFEKEIEKEIPAVFVYSPTFIYLVPKEIKGIDIGQITVPSDRFLSVNNWYIETEKVWRIFMDKRLTNN